MRKPFFSCERSISRVLFRLAATIIYLRRRLPGGCSDSTRKVPRAASSLPYLVLLRVGFVKPASRPTAGALLPHLSTLTDESAVSFSMTLSRRSPPLDVIQHAAL